MKVKFIGYIIVAVLVLNVSSLPSIIRTQVERRGLKLKTQNQTERRIALVLGNGNYADSPLQNPQNDAKDMARILHEFEFEVIFGEDLSQNDMKRNIQAFGDRLRNGGVGLFYFAGHGVQVNGTNYLIPIGAAITNIDDVESQSVNVDFVLEQMKKANNRLNIVILDACRNDPFAKNLHSENRTLKGRGLALMTAPSGTLIAYATAPGTVASDGNGENGVYTQELLKFMRKPKLPIEQVFKQVRTSVQTLTHGKQTPWEESSLTGEFYFNTSEDNVSDKTDISKPANADFPLPANYYIRKGDELADKGRWKEAELAYRQAVILETSNLVWRFRLVKALDENHKYQEYSNEINQISKLTDWYDLELEAKLIVALQPQISWRHVLLGDVFLFSKKYIEAETQYREAIRINPDHIAYNNLAISLMELKKLPEAETELRKSISLNSGYAFARCNLGAALYYQNRYVEAEKEVKEAIRLDPNFAQAHGLLGIIFYSQNMPLDAENELREAIRLDPNLASAHSILGEVLHVQYNFIKAEAEFREAVRLDPKSPALHVSLGGSLIAKGNMSEAEAEFKEAIKLDFKYAPAHDGLARVLYSQSRFAEVEAELRAAISLNPDFPDPHDFLGILYIGQNRPIDAEAQFREALKLYLNSSNSQINKGSAIRPASPLNTLKAANSHYNLGSALYSQSRLSEAEAEFKAAIELDPKSAIAHNGLGNVLYSQGKLSEAQTSYQEAIRLFPNFAIAHVNLGGAFHGLKKYGEAEIECREALRLFALSAEAHHCLANVLYAQKKLTEAEAEYWEALRINPNFEPARQALKQLFRKDQ